jgi:hypothetical protein
MLPKILYRGRFQKLCAIYGARIELWPDYEQSNAHAYIKRCPDKAQADLASARRLDEVIKSFTPSMVSEESQWQALGQLAPNTGLTAVTPAVFSAFSTAAADEAVAEPVAIVFGGKTDAKSAAAAQSEASLEIREERARMIAQNNKKNKKLSGKGILKFQ